MDIPEALIEHTVERMMDRLDKRLLSGVISQDDYDLAVENLDAWAQEKYSRLRCAKLYYANSR